jgi:SAM-dependent methyltransferase
MSDAARWDDRYALGDTPWDTGRPSSELERVIVDEKIGPCAALDLGCGTGTNAVWLAGLGFDVTAIDLSANAIDRGRMKKATAGARVRFLVGDVLDPPEDLVGPFDFFLDRGCYHIVRKLGLVAYQRTIERITRSGSVGLVLAGNANEMKKDHGPPTVTEEELRAEWEPAFEIVWLRPFRVDPVAGSADRPLGWSCLVRRR